MSEFDCDVAVVGSGFGGAVSALRLAERGHDVVVLEAGRRLTPDDLLDARRRIGAYLWQPELGLHGFFWQRIFNDVGIIGASAVGGGSIVWGAVLLEPADAFFADPAWAGLGDWRGELAPHYATAARMLGRVANDHLGVQDEHLRAAAAAVGAADTFGPVPLAVHFGDGPGVRTTDPFFDGKGPDRVGCRLCGGCLVGCPYGSKNTLDLNYLYLAEHAGAQIRARHRVDSIAPLHGGGYVLQSSDPLRRRARHEPLLAERVVLAGGVLGTLELLFRCRDELGSLPRVSPRLGDRVRTNSEAVTGILADDPRIDLLGGPSISSDFHPDARTHITQNRFRGGARVLRAQVGPLVDGDDPRRRALATARTLLHHPGAQLRVMLAGRFEERYTALTVMQRADNELQLYLGRSPVRPWRRVLRSRVGPGSASAPSFLPVANAVTRAYAESIGGTPLNLLPETLGGKSVTAHILGGAVIGADATSGVIGPDHEVHGHPGLYVADASAIPANVGVNPSLTITAMAERFAAGFPEPGARSEAPVPVSLPTTVSGLRLLWRALPAPALDAGVGDFDASFVGPAWLRRLAPRGIGLLGMPGWQGKRFAREDEVLTGTNRTAHGERLAMRAETATSAHDGRAALVVTYGRTAPLPWRHVRDEFRQLPDGRLLGLSLLDAPGPSAPLPFLLTPRR